MLLDFLSSDITAVTRAELPQSGNYSIQFVLDFFTRPVETFGKLIDSLPDTDD